ncbi:FBP domain-containing protein [Microbacterium esteraromaticum]|uniref:FBP domain-containing protein n=1 Tax=Microbacterium esteraromaticum TaxID=57043 RepID=A0A939DU79_9MICO|nr:FBP domain-containing protein [Microbacterium esteraromaticum]MBN7793438.1 FBP domain-containing protein [Microbacterium esteraromaticum]MBN8205300.1 FBP domain-containing protein [Microbacterium esteraromaticum]MBN8415454.1 FBP domain-containing protein [Microbacterium esteraromaticum]MBN8424193.1 FBP domain-containing protein [Microbacterium esteraromaticum]MCA1305449.1 FBP domain-containing protein [Microbacterium esteraromaticum]
MRPLTEEQVRAAIRNADADEIAEVGMPHDFLLTDWDYLDFLAWRDPESSRRGIVIVERDGVAQGIVLRATDPARVRSGMCNICRSLQPGNQVALLTARRAGAKGRRGDSAGTYICADLSCHENVRLAHPLAPNEVRASGQADRRLDGTRHRMEDFVARVLADD